MLSTGPGNQIVLQLSDALQSLQPLLNDPALTGIVDNPFAPLVHDAVRHAFLQFTSLLLQDTVRLSEVRNAHECFEFQSLSHSLMFWFV